MESEERLEYYLNHRAERPAEPDLQRLLQLASWLEAVPMEEASPDLSQRIAHRLGRRRPSLSLYGGLAAAILLAVWVWPRSAKPPLLGAGAPKADHRFVQGGLKQAVPSAQTSERDASGGSSPRVGQMALLPKAGVAEQAPGANAPPVAAPAPSIAYAPAVVVTPVTTAPPLPAPAVSIPTVKAPVAIARATTGGGISPTGIAVAVPTSHPAARSLFLAPVSLEAATTGSQLRLSVKNATRESLSLAAATVELDSLGNTLSWPLALPATAVVPPGGSADFNLPWPLGAVSPGTYQIRLTWPGRTVGGSVYHP